MNALNAVSNATGALVLAVDHFGKSAETGTRGSSAKEAAADAIIACLGNRSEGGVMTNTRIALRKVRGGKQGTETGYVLKQVELGKYEDGDPITSGIIEWNITTVPAAEQRQDGRAKWSPTAAKIRGPL